MSPPKPKVVEQSPAQTPRADVSNALALLAPANNRLDAIYAQLKDLQKFKDEIMDDLDEFMEEVEE